MKRSDFAYTLPPELIAQEPRPRGGARMMVLRTESETIEHRRFAELSSLLRPDDLLVLNDTRVIPARLYAEPKGAMRRPIEILLVRQISEQTWECWCKPARRVRPGDRLRVSEKLTGLVMEKREEGKVVVKLEGDLEEVERVGLPPLPPYIRRDKPQAGDREAYQTVYASQRGAIAAPTAGLHFTAAILEEISRRGVEIARITLHVGLGTFKPVKVEDLRAHRMDVERYEISEEAARMLNRALDSGRRVVAVGTTSVRALESAAAAGTIRAGWNETDLFITPGFQFRVVRALLTNFHLPESTLLMLVSAFAGIELTRRAYHQAIAERYLFYSYGDCMFIAHQ